MKSFISIPLVLGFIFNSSCARKASDSSGIDSNKAQSAPASQGINVRPASNAECANGGSVYSVFIDLNANGVLDTSESPLSSQVVCNGTNGTNGTNGHNAVMGMNRVSVGAAVCAAGSGVQLSAGLDLNDNSSLDAAEINQTSMLCDGENGAVGAAGPAGVNGHSMAFATAAASAAQCPAGGSVILMAVDESDSGVYDPLSSSQQSAVLCNGLSAATPAYSVVEPIVACGNTGSYREVLLRLYNGQVLASFSENVEGRMTRLAFLPDGTFMNTDSSGCTFSLSTSADGLTRSISWFGAVQSSWAL